MCMFMYMLIVCNFFIINSKAIVQQLETHLGNVKHSVQKGKDLEKHKMSPKFVSKDVTELETNWEDVYKAATEKLTLLKVIFLFFFHSHISHVSLFSR